MVIKVIAFDVYGTILAYAGQDRWGADLTHPPREGLEILLDKCNERGIIPVTSSDVESQDVRADLARCFERFPERKLSTGRFCDFIWLNQMGVKDYFVIVDKYSLEPHELLAVDDKLANVQAAREIGCHGVHCTRYVAKRIDDWSFRAIDLDSF